MKFFNGISHLLSMLGPFKRSALILFVIITISAVTAALGLGMVLPLLEIAINSGANSGIGTKFLAPLLDMFPKEFHLIFVCGLTLFLIVVKNLFFLLKTYYSNRFTANLRQYWSSGIMDNYLYSQFAALQKQKQGVFLNNMLHEPSYASKAIRDIVDFLAKGTISLFILMLLIVVSWKITLAVSAVACVFILLLWRVTRTHSVAVGKKKIRLNQQISGVAAESIRGIRQIKIFSMEKRALKEFSDKLINLVNTIVKFNVERKLPQVLGEVMIVALIVGIFLYYHFMAVSVKSIIPVVGLFVVCAQKLFSNFSQLLSQRMSILSFTPALNLAHTLISDRGKREDIQGKKTVAEPKSINVVTFRDVSFSYTADSLLFCSLNLEFKRSCITAIAGPSGSGKSTICDLIAGFFKPQEGKIYIEDNDMQTLDIDSWRRRIGYISQDAFLFDTTVRDNILMGKPNAAKDEMVRAAQLSGAHEFIKALPQKYDTVLGDSGVSLSVGERQRIAIARAFIRDPDVLILDEATSSLDVESEQHIHASIKSFFHSKVVVFITHRLSSLVIADYIYVIDDKGLIAEAGKYEELLKAKGIFWKLEQLSRTHPEEPLVVT
ncbi:MAG: ABC transporter ATP-binding protein [Candidatus Omnitrophota bacterium]|nr:MAG: ABC transporter ATP-binding protein [Candidatus Omnitrophota bacterium]